MQEGQWSRLMMLGVNSRTLGLVGFGDIGKEIARRAAAFDMEILYYCHHPKKEWEETYHARIPLFEAVKMRSLHRIQHPTQWKTLQG